MRVSLDPIKDAKEQLGTRKEDRSNKNIIPSNLHRKVITHNFMVHTPSTKRLRLMSLYYSARAGKLAGKIERDIL